MEDMSCCNLSNLQNYHCWMDQGDSNWFLGVPVILIIFFNIFFLTKVLIILRSKLRYYLKQEILFAGSASSRSTLE